MTRPTTFRDHIGEGGLEIIRKVTAEVRSLGDEPNPSASKAAPAAEPIDVDDVGLRAARFFEKLRRPAFPSLPPIETPAAIIDGESAEVARASMAAVDEQAAMLRRFIRDGATYRRETGRAVPTSEWDAAHDRIHDLARLRQRLQEALGRYRRQRTSFERAFVEVATTKLPAPVLAEIAAEAQRATREPA